jgi:SAM-dependent methyltransferase
MFFDKLNIWESFDNAKIMHFAPEQHLENKIKQCNPSQYIKADLFPQKNDSIKRIDATQIPFESENIDIIIANHILEHITLFEKALSEFYRVLKPGGFAILQTPFSLLLNKNFEDTGINTAPLRSFFYGQSDHVRVFGYKNLCESLKKIGFLLDFKNHNDFFKKNTGKIYGINLKEPLMLVKKPK